MKDSKILYLTKEKKLNSIAKKIKRIVIEINENNLRQRKILREREIQKSQKKGRKVELGSMILCDITNKLQCTKGKKANIQAIFRPIFKEIFCRTASAATIQRKQHKQFSVLRLLT